MQSLGFVETQGYVPAFAVADAMVKAAASSPAILAEGMTPCS